MNTKGEHTFLLREHSHVVECIAFSPPSTPILGGDEVYIYQKIRILFLNFFIHNENKNKNKINRTQIVGQERRDTEIGPKV